MGEASIESLESSVLSLRRSNRRLVLACIAGPIVAVAVSAGLSRPGRLEAQSRARGIPAVVEARGFILRDQAGGIRAKIDYDGRGITSLGLYDGKNPRAEFRLAGNDSPSLSFLYENGREAFSIIGGGDAEPSLDMYDKQGGARVQFGLSDGKPNLSLHHSKLKTRFQLGISSDGVPYLDFFDKEDKILPMLDKAGRPLAPKP